MSVRFCVIILLVNTEFTLIVLENLVSTLFKWKCVLTRALERKVLGNQSMYSYSYLRRSRAAWLLYLYDSLGIGFINQVHLFYGAGFSPWTPRKMVIFGGVVLFLSWDECTFFSSKMLLGIQGVEIPEVSLDRVLCVESYVRILVLRMRACYMSLTSCLKRSLKFQKLCFLSL